MRHDARASGIGYGMRELRGVASFALGFMIGIVFGVMLLGARFRR